MIFGASSAGMYQYTRLSARSCRTPCCIGCSRDSASIQYAWNVDEMPNAVEMANSSGAGMNLRRSTDRTIGAELASVKISDACMTTGAPFITA